jgi:hypothetical protein
MKQLILGMQVESDRAPTTDEITDALYNVISQACFREDTRVVHDADSVSGLRIVRSNPRYESDFLTYYAEGISMLGRLGRLHVTEASGRWVVAVDP